MRFWNPETSLLGVIVRIFVILLVLVLVLWGIIWGIGKIFGDDPEPAPKPIPTSGSSTDSGDDLNVQSKPAGQGQVQTGQTGQTGHTSSTSTTTPSTQLANSGPGEVLAIFAGASVAGVIGYQVVLRKRQVS